MPALAPADLDTLGRAFERALAALPNGYEEESTRRLIMEGLIEAAGKGVRDEDILTDCALAKVTLYDKDSMTAVMWTAPL